MSFAHTDEQRMLAEMLDGALGPECDWESAVDAIGLGGLGVPEDEDGGLGTGLREAAVVAAAFGRANAGLPWAEHWSATTLGARGAGLRASTVGDSLAKAGDEAQRLRAEDAMVLLHCAEMVGLCRTMIRDAADYIKQRRQFGVVIASFQVLRHRMADMAMLLEQGEALVDLAIDSFDGDAAARARAVSAARVMMEDAGRAVSEGAVQLHGAMGLTAELRLGGYFRRVRTLLQGDGTGRAHLARYAA